MTWKQLLAGILKPQPAHPHNPLENFAVLTASLFEDSKLPSRRPLSTLEQEYFLLDYDRQANIPSLTLDLENPRFDNLEFSNCGEAALECNIPLRICEPVPAQPDWAEILRGNTPIVHQSVRDALQQLNIPGLEFFPASILVSPYLSLRTYYALHLEHDIRCVDHSLSDIEESEQGTRVNRIALDHRVLHAIPHEERLAFRLEDGNGEYLFHRDIVTLLTTMGVRGASFIAVGDWVCPAD